jgi:hypothetical protein
MYSGNHSPCHPLESLLAAAEQFRDDNAMAFCFVGGGSEFAKVQRFASEKKLSNIICLPYQRLERLAGSLSAADVHVVVMGKNFVGTIHPCKIYNVMRVAPAILYIGPVPSHVADIREKADSSAFAAVPNGDAGAIVEVIQRLRRSTLAPESFRPLSEPFSQHQLLPRFISLLESLPADPHHLSISRS